jgi:hypothetical protein
LPGSRGTVGSPRRGTATAFMPMKPFTVAEDGWSTIARQEEPGSVGDPADGIVASPVPIRIIPWSRHWTGRGRDGGRAQELFPGSQRSSPLRLRLRPHGVLQNVAGDLGGGRGVEDGRQAVTHGQARGAKHAAGVYVRSARRPAYDHVRFLLQAFAIDHLAVGRPDRERHRRCLLDRSCRNLDGGPSPTQLTPISPFP